MIPTPILKTGHDTHRRLIGQQCQKRLNIKSTEDTHWDRIRERQRKFEKLIVEGKERSVDWHVEEVHYSTGLDWRSKHWAGKVK